MFKVLYDFVAEEEGEISVKAGDIVEDFSNGNTLPEGWILVKVIDRNSIGFVPRNYIENYQQLILPQLSNESPQIKHLSTKHTFVTNLFNESSNPAKFNGNYDTNDFTDFSYIPDVQTIDKNNHNNDDNIIIENININNNINSKTNHNEYIVKPLKNIYDETSIGNNNNYNGGYLNNNKTVPMKNYGDINSQSSPYNDRNLNIKKTNLEISDYNLSKTALMSNTERKQRFLLTTKKLKAFKPIHHISKQVSINPSKMPSLNDAAETENYDEIASEVEDYFSRFAFSMEENLTVHCKVIDDVIENLKDLADVFIIIISRYLNKKIMHFILIKLLYLLL
jgi:hypothetical protein